MKVSQVGTWARRRLSSRRGQNTVEYLLMLMVVVAIAGMAAVALKKYMPGLMSQIQNAISGAAGSIGQTPSN